MTPKNLLTSSNLSHSFPGDRRYLLLVFIVAAAILVGAVTVYSPVGTVAGLMIVIAWLVLFRFPAEALAILVVGFYVYPLIMDTIGVGTSSVATAIYYVVLSTAALVGSLAQRHEAVRIVLRRRVSLMMVAFSGWMLLNWLIFSLSNEFALKKLASALWLMVIPFFIPQFMDRRLIERFLRACILIGILGGVLTVIGAASGAQVDAVRLSVSDDVSPLGFAYSLGVSALLAIVFSFFSKRTTAKVLSIAFLLGVIALIAASGSRGPIVALGFGLLVVGLLVNRSNRIYLVLALGLCVLVLFAALPYVSPAAQARIGVLLPQNNGSATSQLFAESRGYLWLYTLNAWRSSPVVGIGVGNFIVFSQNASYWEAAGFAHNFALEILSELGLIGIMLFSVFLFNIARRALFLSRTGRFDWAVVSAVALFVFSLVKMSFSGQLQVSVEFWVACGLIANCVNEVTKNGANSYVGHQ